MAGRSHFIQGPLGECPGSTYQPGDDPYLIPQPWHPANLHIVPPSLYLGGSAQGRSHMCPSTNSHGLVRWVTIQATARTAGHPVLGLSSTTTMAISATAGKASTGLCHQSKRLRLHRGHHPPKPHRECSTHLGAVPSHYPSFVPGVQGLSLQHATKQGNLGESYLFGSSRGPGAKEGWKSTILCRLLQA